MRCVEIRESLPAYVKGAEASSSLALRRHLARCRDCREELSRYESLSRGLVALRSELAEPPAGLLRSLKAIPSQASRIDAVRAHVARNRPAYVGGALTIAGALSAAIWATRRQRLGAARA